MKKIYKKLMQKLELLKDFPLLFLRIMLAIGFYKPALAKVKDFESIAEWFSSMNYPAPLFSAYLAGITEISGVVLLILGFGTRIISIPLMFVMVVAIFTVHISNGFAAGDNGFEIPLYYIVMLFTLLVYGSGKISVDYLISRKR